MDTESKNEIFTQITLEIFKVVGQLNVEGDSMAAEYGLTAARWKIIGTIGLSEKKITISEVARQIGQSRQSVQRLINVMTRDGLIVQVHNPKHKRSKLVLLTERAKSIHHCLYAKQIDWAKEHSSKLNKSHLKTTLRILKEINLQGS